MVCDEYNEIIGIHEEELTHKDISLLATFLLPYNVKFPILQMKNKSGEKSFTRLNQVLTLNLNWITLIVSFTFQLKKIKLIRFYLKMRYRNLFAKQVPILWENGHEGIIIEEQTIDEESISYEQIIDILMSDLYVKINFFVGPYTKGLEGYCATLSIINQMPLKTVFTYSNKTVVTYIDAIPYLLIHQTDSDFRTDIGKTILQEYIDDEETLKMIETFVQCNLNLSETSKVLHMHRNSFQYRLDRFLEKTGIDVRQFHHAMTVYLALLARK